MSRFTSNKQIENAAISWVLDYERSRGRNPQDTRGMGPTDIKSPPLSIEVKAYGTTGRGQDLWLEPPQYEEARENPNFQLYVVENVRRGDSTLFTLRVIEGKQLVEMVQRARERRYYLLPWSTAAYDKMPVSSIRP
jgi:hypothetical protein